MTVELITGHAGSAHVSSADDGWLNVGAFGAGKYVLDTGTRLACTVQSANLVTIGVGDAVFEGRHVRVSVAENVAIDNGAQGVSRNDIVCIKYEYNSSTSVETASLAVVKGTASSSTPVDPTIPSGSILEGATTAYMPLWRIPIDSINVGTPQKLYGDVVVTLNGLLSKTWTASQIPNLSAGKITSGTFDAVRIPALDASKVTSGTFAAARIPSLDASKITSGTFAVDRVPTLTAAKIPSLDASKIGSGALPVSRGGTGKTSGTVCVVDVLYYNPSGSNGAITLSASAANYTDIEIMYRNSVGGEYDSTFICDPNGKIAALVSVNTNSSGHMRLVNKPVEISGTSIAQEGYAGYADLSSGSYTAGNYIYIHKVLGYK